MGGGRVRTSGAMPSPVLHEVGVTISLHRTHYMEQLHHSQLRRLHPPSDLVEPLRRPHFNDLNRPVRNVSCHPIFPPNRPLGPTQYKAAPNSALAVEPGLLPSLPQRPEHRRKRSEETKGRQFHTTVGFDSLIVRYKFPHLPSIKISSS